MLDENDRPYSSVRPAIFCYNIHMQLFGLVSIIIAVLLGVLWLANPPGGSGSTGPANTGVNYQEAIDAARAIPGAPAKTDD